MSRSKHSEAQIIAALKQVEAGRTAEEVARECSVSKHTIHAWKSRFGGMEASEAQKLRALEDENGRLKRWSARLEMCQWIRETLDKESIWDEARSTSLSRW